MSIMVLKVEKIEKLANSFPTIKKATYGKLDLPEWCRLLGAAYALNIKSWNERYKDDVITDEEIKTVYKPNLKNDDKFKNDCEILKALQCLSCNIELDKMNFKEKKTETDLKAVIEHLKNHIISNLDDYKKAAWS